MVKLVTGSERSWEFCEVKGDVLMEGLKTGQLRWLQEKEKTLRAEDPVSSSLREEEYSRQDARVLSSSVPKSPGEGI